MRYLKNFESKWWEKVVDKDELKSSAESYLAYLMDEDFQVGINLDRHEDDRGGIDLHLFRDGNSFSEVDPYGEDDPYDLFYWNDIKDHFIPFLIHLNNNYEINGKSQFFTNTPHLTYQYYTVQEMIDDKPSELDCYLYEIEMSISI